MANSSPDEERYSRMHSFVIWLPLLVGRRAIFLFTFVIFAVEGSGRCGAVSSGSGTLDGTLLGSDDDTIHLVVFFPHVHFDMRIARAPKWDNLFGREQTTLRHPGHQCARPLPYDAGRLDLGRQILRSIRGHGAPWQLSIASIPAL